MNENSYNFWKNSGGFCRKILSFFLDTQSCLHSVEFFAKNCLEFFLKAALSFLKEGKKYPDVSTYCFLIGLETGWLWAPAPRRHDVLRPSQPRTRGARRKWKGKRSVSFVGRNRRPRPGESRGLSFRSHPKGAGLKINASHFMVFMSIVLGPL